MSFNELEDVEGRDQPGVVGGDARHLRHEDGGGGLRLLLRAVALEVIRTNPAAAMRTPPRNRRARRALEGWEMAEIAQCTGLHSADPELDLLLLSFHRETAARQGGALGLRIGDIRLDRPSVLLLEKGNKEREVPASTTLLRRMLSLASDRGAACRSGSSAGS